MSKELLKIGVDLGIEKYEQCAVINLHYNGIDHIIYETHDKEQVEALNKIMEVENRKLIDNANPSEALKIVYNNFDYLISDVGIENDDVNICLKTIKEQLPTIKQALLKAQEPKQYLKWEDLEFSFKDKYMKVKLNGNIYTLRYTRNVLMEFPVVYLEFDNTEITIIDCKKQFFNDLRLERVEE